MKYSICIILFFCIHVNCRGQNCESHLKNVTTLQTTLCPMSKENHGDCFLYCCDSTNTNFILNRQHCLVEDEPCENPHRGSSIYIVYSNHKLDKRLGCIKINETQKEYIKTKRLYASIEYGFIVPYHSLTDDLASIRANTSNGYFSISAGWYKKIGYLKPNKRSINSLALNVRIGSNGNNQILTVGPRFSFIRKSKVIPIGFKFETGLAGLTRSFSMNSEQLFFYAEFGVVSLINS